MNKEPFEHKLQIRHFMCKLAVTATIYDKALASLKTSAAWY